MGSLWIWLKYSGISTPKHQKVSKHNTVPQWATWVGPHSTQPRSLIHQSPFWKQYLQNPVLRICGNGFKNNVIYTKFSSDKKKEYVLY